jgi:hypothetical protein
MNKKMTAASFLDRYLLGWVVSLACIYKRIAENEYKVMTYCQRNRFLNNYLILTHTSVVMAIT